MNRYNLTDAAMTPADNGEWCRAADLVTEPVADERAAFNAWRETESWARLADATAQDPDDDGSFKRLMDLAALTAWQARAALSAPPPPVAAPTDDHQAVARNFHAAVCQLQDRRTTQDRREVAPAPMQELTDDQIATIAIDNKIGPWVTFSDISLACTPSDFLMFCRALLAAAKEVK